MEKCLNVNLLALMKLTRYALPYIEKGTGGAIINIASSEGRDVCQFNHAPYVASKFGVVGFSGSLFEDVREKGIKVCSIEPEHISIPCSVEDDCSDIGKMIQPEDIAKTVVFVTEFPATACPTEIYLSSQKSPFKMVPVDA
jgi:NADP-dependent 3-hydroxy acid dehydrogenase YdfG